MLENLRIKLVKIAKEAEKYGLCKEKTGSFSIKDKTTGYVLITPSQVNRSQLRPENICIVDSNGSPIEIQSEMRPSREILMHLEVYKEKKDVRAIMYTHSLYATIFAVANKGIPPVVADARYYGGYIYVAPYEKAQTIELAKSVIEPLRKSDACLLERHGLLVVSDDVDKVLLKARYVEDVAEIYYKALLLNKFKEPNRLDKDELK
ncbi:class II aldolase/adducin family protein [Clostridium saccharobutylicum]|uniref:L-ribulose-5-phosphate 4-epimerase n=1 Tax=Clostridium saccharobutylicum DSM 13864 TaxID=1345695 RepID=U5MSF2_CLOSA|nr:class II aldolase/adducin family protein [Clostridium saccharobutylicum]AGX43739.1 L-ribulose-5-phosphate 4-epimerase [Clostridium saccharobutylicum DSM 13864]AQR91037.1 L-fuculose phosphate aldolase [Clostridium saccharobutylicum]AQS00941.1 L-fuculose phosphate aldolase [Clostridium saccharobutylicum]AQS10679.1 L-fuculose phosphate aldolase [Clostridium saccharobutylicum]AQS14924.1 L-fuculose phosphate aldolase [Clostridium saccharobutylicum]